MPCPSVSQSADLNQTLFESASAGRARLLPSRKAPCQRLRIAVGLAVPCEPRTVAVARV